MVDKPRQTPRVLASDEREDIGRIAAAHGARNVRVFGSVARGESRALATSTCLSTCQRVEVCSTWWRSVQILRRRLASPSTS